MIRLTTPLLMTALSLIMSAITHTADGQTVAAQTAKTPNIKILYLPFNITAPGTYVVTKNLMSSVTQGGEINISTATPGPVVVDLKGFTITGSGSNTSGINIGGISPNISSPYPITIENGTINNVEIGVAISTGANLSHMVIKNVVFNIVSTGVAVGYGVSMVNVSSSLISNCTINGATYGISDLTSAGGNIYNEITFSNTTFQMFVFGGFTLTLNHCEFAPPPAN